jgi:Fe-S cluster assembly protein SufD
VTTLSGALDAASLPVPTAELEDWRYSRIAALDPSAYEVPAGSPAAAAVRGDAADAFDDVSDAHRADPVVVEVKPGEVRAEPIVLDLADLVDGTATFPHLVVRAGADSEVTVVVHRSSADVDAVVLPLVELDVAAAARVRYVEVQRLGGRVWQLGRLSANVAADATLRIGSIALGGSYARTAICCRILGRGASAELVAMSFGEADQMHDVRVLMDHVAGNSTSDMLFKGAVAGRSRAVYTGLIHIGKQGAGSRANQVNRYVTLSEGARAESVPNLEIENNDVRCSHASAVGPVDEDQRFYLESRGVPSAVAERLIVLGFFEEVLDRLVLPSGSDLAEVRSELAGKLDRRDGKLDRRDA